MDGDAHFRERIACALGIKVGGGKRCEGVHVIGKAGAMELSRTTTG